MKKTFLACALLAFAGWVSAQTAGPADAVKSPGKALPTALAKKDAEDAAKKKEEKIGKIEGMEVARAEGFIGVQVVNGVFKIRTYDAKKKPVAANFTKIGLRWNVQYQKAPERTVLFPSGGVGEFSSEKVVKPPYAFKLFVTLIKGEGDDAPVENYQIDFKSP
jgi:hypothetical protein